MDGPSQSPVLDWGKKKIINSYILPLQCRSMCKLFIHFTQSPALLNLPAVRWQCRSLSYHNVHLQHCSPGDRPSLRHTAVTNQKLLSVEDTPLLCPAQPMIGCTRQWRRRRQCLPCLVAAAHTLLLFHSHKLQPISGYYSVRTRSFPPPMPGTATEWWRRSVLQCAAAWVLDAISDVGTPSPESR